MRTLTWPPLLLLLAPALEGKARADEFFAGPNATARWQRVSADIGLTSNHSWDPLPASGLGGSINVGYDFFLTPAHAVGLIAGTAVDMGSYGSGFDVLKWNEAGLRYTYAFVTAPKVRARPFVSGGAALGRARAAFAGYRMTTGFADLGVEWFISRYFWIEGRASERLSRISSSPAPKWWHNAVAVNLGVVVALPL